MENDFTAESAAFPPLNCFYPTAGIAHKVTVECSMKPSCYLYEAVEPLPSNPSSTWRIKKP